MDHFVFNVLSLYSKYYNTMSFFSNLIFAIIACMFYRNHLNIAPQHIQPSHCYLWIRTSVANVTEHYDLCCVMLVCC